MKLGIKLLRHYCHNLYKFLLLGINLYADKSCQKSAGSLTYMTLFAIVPLMTVTYSVFSLIPAFQSVGGQFQTLILSHILPSNEQLIVKYLNTFSTQARKLTAFGVLFLVASAYFMLKNIEKNFNAIWNVPRERKGVANFLLYWAILSLGPLLLGLALMMNTYLVSLKLFVGNHNALDWVGQLFEWLPWALMSMAFTLLFVAVPNCKVHTAHAIAGGILTTLVFEVCKAGFGWTVKHSSLNLIYGAFAAVPLFLLWINLSWMVILGGAVFVRTIGLFQIDLKDRKYPDLFASLLVLWQFHQASFKGDSLSNTQLLHLGLSTDQWQRIREILLANNLIAVNQQNGYVLSRDLARVSLYELMGYLGDAARMPLDQSQLKTVPWLKSAQDCLGGLDDIERQKAQISLEAFFEAERFDSSCEKTI